MLKIHFIGVTVNLKVGVFSKKLGVLSKKLGVFLKSRV